MSRKIVEWAWFERVVAAQAEAVFRYYLVRDGDWESALSRTTQAFQMALECLTARRLLSGNDIPNLWRIVVENRGPGFAPPYSFSLSRDEEIPQSQMRLYARAAEITQRWASLPEKTVEILRLIYFARLPVSLVAVITHARLDVIVRSIFLHGGQYLIDLSEGIQLAGSFISGLKQTLKRQSIQDWTPHSFRRRPMIFQWFNSSLLCHGWVSRVVVLAILAVLVVTAWRSFSRSTYVFTNASEAKIAPTPPLIIRSIPQDLVVVDEQGEAHLLALDTGRLSQPVTGAISFNPVMAISSKHVNSYWALDRKAVAFINWGDPTQLLVFRFPEGNPGILSLPEGDQWFSLSWSADSVWLEAFILRKASETSQPGGIDQEIFLVDDRVPSSLSPIVTPEFDLSGYRDMTSRFVGIVLLSPDPQAGKNPNDKVHFSWSNAEYSFCNGYGHGRCDSPWLRSPDGKKIAMVETSLITPSICPYVLKWFTGENNTWHSFCGRIDNLTWTSDSSTLIVRVRDASGSRLLRIDAVSGKYQTIGSGLKLFGMRNRPPAAITAR